MRRLRELAGTRVKYGYRRLMVLLRSEGINNGHNAVYRIYREGNLGVKRGKRRKRAANTRTTPEPAKRVNDRWWMDFVTDRLETDRAFRVPGRVESAAFQADLSAVKTGIANRDHNMRVWLQTNEFPQVGFEFRAVDRSPNGASTARGRFQLHGQMHDIRFPVTITVNGGLATIDGTATSDTQEFGLPIIRFWVLTVDPVVQVHFHLQGSVAR
jgi:hypothetical protein